MNRNLDHRMRGVSWGLAALLALLLAGCGGKKTSTGGSGTPIVTPPSGELGVVVEEVDKQGHKPEHCPLSKSSGADHVRWHNPTSTLRTLTFTGEWPFMESREDIKVPPNGWTPWYTLDASITSTVSFPYSCSPPLTDPGGGPDQPSIESGP